MSFTVENLEFCLMIIARVSAFIYSAPFFSMSNMPRKVKTGLSVFIGLLIIQMVDYTPLEYEGTIGFAVLVMQEVIVGLLLGYCANICSYILNFSGQLIDMEIGFSMVNVLDPVSKVQTTVSGNYYSYMVMLMLFATNMHYVILSAIFDSFQLIPVGKAIFHRTLYEIMLQFMTDYFVIGFRIILPIFAATLLVNVILGVLAKVAPQMNMFVVGIQLKVFVGLFMLYVMVDMIPEVSDFIFVKMKDMLELIMAAMAP